MGPPVLVEASSSKNKIRFFRCSSCNKFKFFLSALELQQPYFRCCYGFRDKGQTSILVVLDLGAL